VETSFDMTRIAFIAADSADAQTALSELNQRYAAVNAEDADVIVALGGDGQMLQTLRETFHRDVRVFGMNCGTVGFLMNAYRVDDLPERIAAADEVIIHPLQMVATDAAGKQTTAMAINEVSVLRQTAQAAKIQISIDDVVRLQEMICDGVLVATAAGSTAYNLSVHGPILPLGANILALTPISPFRPRRWRGAVLPAPAHIRFDILEAHKRPVSAVADSAEMRDVVRVEIHQDSEISLRLLHDPDHNLEERILMEQFAP
jgi:NAD+ kinase